MSIRKILKDCSTDEYGEDYDVTNVLATAAGFTGLVLVVIAFFIRWDFNLIEYSAGIAALLASVSGAQRLKPKALAPVPANPGDSTQGPVVSDHQGESQS